LSSGLLRLLVEALLFVVPHASDDAVGEVSFVGASCFSSGFAFADFAVDVGDRYKSGEVWIQPIRFDTARPPQDRALGQKNRRFQHMLPSPNRRSRTTHDALPRFVTVSNSAPNFDAKRINTPNSSGMVSVEAPKC
jgi:hypothetical protein